MASPPTTILGKIHNEFANPDSVMRRTGIAVKNETEFPLLVVCSQLTPLHWGKVMPGETWNEHNEVGMGKVWFTVSVTLYDEKMEPTTAGVAARIATLAVAYAIAPWAFIVSGAITGITSVVGCKRDGVYADKKTLTAVGTRTHDGAYVLALH